MILLAHLLLGAVVGYKIHNMPLAIVLAVLCHYLLDCIPHIEYSIKNITKRNWEKSFPDFIKVFLDFGMGVALIAIFSKNQPIIYICAIIAILPDTMTLLSLIMPAELLKAHDNIHEKIHFLKYKKISKIWRISSQLLTVIICIILLKN